MLEMNYKNLPAKKKILDSFLKTNFLYDSTHIINVNLCSSYSTSKIVVYFEQYFNERVSE